jgi:hypothetical protein
MRKDCGLDLRSAKIEISIIYSFTVRVIILAYFSVSFCKNVLRLYKEFKNKKPLLSLRGENLGP